ncbi:hypothetical protein L6164_003002 [Bauhinia variegata]|uniref:Uncharacterized protein n=1 Tax=Bauhinia variegata TaxID=167791 RepID=A0ACB9Q012_BAUVA|nr:hypothetical protein L6164_003002 [Bauhinia variegata]
MKGLITLILILAFASPHLCVGLNPIIKDTFNVMDYGAVGDGKSDDSQAISKAWNDTCGTAIPGAATLVLPGGKTFYLKPMDFQGSCKSKYINIQLIFIHDCNDLTINGLRNINSPRNHMAIHFCNGVRINDLHIQAPGKSLNTDGINIALSTNINIVNSSIATGDDCISILNGTSFVNISGIACGPGHGISIGSIGSNTSSYDTVKEVHVRNCSFNGTLNGVRIKTSQDRVGYVGKVSFEELTMIASHHPIIIDQHYFNKVNETGVVAVNVTDITFRGIHGTCADEKAIELNCNKKFGCQNLILDNINLTSSVPGKKTIASCFNAHGVAKSVIPSNPCLQK